MTSSPFIVCFSIGVDHPITPDEPLPPLPEIPRGSIVVIEGRAPIWTSWVTCGRLLRWAESRVGGL